MASSKRRSVRQAATRKRSIYVDPDTDDDFSYDNESAESMTDLPATTVLPQKRRKTSTRPRKPHTRSRSAVTKPRPSRKTIVKVIAKPRKPNSLGESRKLEYTGPSDNVKPAWTSLPVDILRQAFVYAALPASGALYNTSVNGSWLVRASRTCRAFAIPALEAFYYSPSLSNLQQPHDFLQLLQIPAEHKYIDYNRKVKSLYIDVTRLAYTALHRPLFDISTLIPELPTLRDIEIIHPVSAPPFRPLKIQKWHYPQGLFRNLEQSGIRLRSWRWTREMIPIDNPTAMYEFMAQTHSSTSFQSLEQLAICGFGPVDSAEPSAEDGEAAELAPGLASCISMLPNLKDLTFITCEVVMDTFLQRLPTGLHRLELTNCLELTSDLLVEFLSRSGAQLRELKLDSNAALTLKFLRSLRANCPRLEVLTMDFHYYSERINSNDAEPLYDELLSIDDIPTWPSTLRHLQLIHLHKCPLEASQNLFRSLVEGARDLPDLRHLVIQAHINIPWRDRAGFRDQWIDRLQHVFSRRRESVNPYLGSLRQYRLYKEAEMRGRAAVMARQKDGKSRHDRHTGQLRSPDKPIPPHRNDGKTATPNDDQQRRSRRVAASQIVQSVSPSATESSSEEDEDSHDEPDTSGDFVQGLCDVVDIRIDNQRPRETQFTEGDFLDDEASGDDDWHEGADVGDDDGHAW